MAQAARLSDTYPQSMCLSRYAEPGKELTTKIFPAWTPPIQDECIHIMLQLSAKETTRLLRSRQAPDSFASDKFTMQLALRSTSEGAKGVVGRGVGMQSGRGQEGLGDVCSI